MFKWIHKRLQQNIVFMFHEAEGWVADGRSEENLEEDEEKGEKIQSPESYAEGVNGKTFNFEMV
jgi:hypothetical protein